MSVEVINIQKELPKPTRKRHSALEDTEEWTYVITKLSHGLKPNEALRVVMTPETLAEVKHASRMFRMRVVNYIKDLKLDYDVFQRGTTEDGTPILYIANPDKRFS